MFKNCLIIICCLCLLYSDEIDISNFYNPALNGPCITLDPTYGTAYYFNQYNSNVLSDYQILDIRINGSVSDPVGNYIISPFFKTFIKDTLSSTAFEHNRGDYAYNENIIFINNKYENNLSSFFMAQSKKYNGLQSIDSNSDVLQNYFLNIYKDYFSSSNTLSGNISTSLMYHKENVTIPLNAGFYNRDSEGFLSGFSINSSYADFMQVKISNSFQLNREYSDLGNYSDKYNHWFDLVFNLNLSEYIDIISGYNREDGSYDTETDQLDLLYDRVVLDKFFLTSQLYYNKFVFGLTMLMFNQKNDLINTDFDFKSPRLNFNLTYNFNDNFTFNLDRITYSFLDNFSDNILFDVTSLKVQYNNSFLKLMFEPFELTSYVYNPELLTESNLDKEGKITGVNTLLSFDNNYIIGEVKSSIYGINSIYNSYSISPINFYSNYSILFAPQIGKKRFRPFIGLNGVFMNLNGRRSYIDINSDGNFPFFNKNGNSGLQKKALLANIQLGIIVKQFKISYHFTNPMNRNVLFSFSDSYQSIAPFSKLQVTWQFLD